METQQLVRCPPHGASWGAGIDLGRHEQDVVASDKMFASRVTVVTTNLFRQENNPLVSLHGRLSSPLRVKLNLISFQRVPLIMSTETLTSYQGNHRDVSVWSPLITIDLAAHLSFRLSHAGAPFFLSRSLLCLLFCFLIKICFY